VNDRDPQSTPPTQKTPTRVEIPVPTRHDFLRNMNKVAPPVMPKQRDDGPDEDDA